MIARIIQRHQLLDLALLVADDDGSQRGAQIGQWIDRVELAGLDDLQSILWLN